MGTNYYWRHNMCSCCQRYDEWHIGKSMSSFRAHFGEETWNEATRRYDDPPVLVASWVGWKELLRKDGEVWNEYGDRIETEQFIADVEKTDADGRRRQYDWCAREYAGTDRLDRVAPGCDWLDADGFSFYGGEFS